MLRARTSWALALALVGCCGLAGRAAAQSSGTVVIVRVAGDERIVLRLRAELRSHAWRVIEVTARGEQARRSLETLAANRGASAALRARPHQLAVELWTMPQGDQETAGTEELIVAAGAGADAGVLALRVSEALRARGVGPTQVEAPTGATARPSADPRKAGASPSSREAGSGVQPSTEGDQARAGASQGRDDSAASADNAPAVPDAPTSQPQAAQPAAGNEPGEAASSRAAPAADGGERDRQANPATQAETEPETDMETDVASDANTNGADASAETELETADRSLLYLELAPAVGVSPGGFAPRFDAWANLRLQPSAACSFSAFVLVPLLQGRVRGEEDSASVHTLAAGAGVDLQADLHAWEVSGGVAVASLITWIRRVETPDPFVPHDQTLRTPAVLARLGLARRVSPGTQLSARLLVGFSVPEKVTVRFRPGDQKTWGVPFVSLALGMQLALPWER
jgi:hypothetical protein